MHTLDSFAGCKRFGNTIATFPSVRIAIQASLAPASSSSKQIPSAPQGVPTFAQTLQNQAATLSEYAISTGKKKGSCDDKEQAHTVKQQGSDNEPAKATVSVLAIGQVSTPTNMPGLGCGGFAVAQAATTTQGGSEASTPSLSVAPEPATVPVATMTVQQQTRPESVTAANVDGAEEVVAQGFISDQELQTVPVKGNATVLAKGAAELAPQESTSTAQPKTSTTANAGVAVPASLITEATNEQIPGLAAMMQELKGNAAQHKAVQMPMAAPPPHGAPKAHLAFQGNELDTQVPMPEQVSGTVSTLHRPSTATSTLQDVMPNKIVPNGKGAPLSTSLQTAPSGTNLTDASTAGLQLVAMPNAATDDGTQQDSPEGFTSGNSSAEVAAVDGPRSKAHATLAEASAGPIGLTQAGVPAAANLLNPAGRSTVETGRDGSGQNVAAQSAPSTAEAAEAVKNGHEPISELPSVTNARLLQSLSRSEMQVQVHSADFGRITVHTAYGRDSISAQITLDNAQLGSAVAAHVPAIEHKLGQDAGLRASVSVHTQSGNSRGEQQQPNANSNRRSGTAHTEAGSSALPLASVPPVSSSSVAAGNAERGRLDIRI